MKNELKLDLLDNSIDSLINGLNNYKIAVEGDDKYLKYAVLSLSIYIELSLKY